MKSASLARLSIAALAFASFATHAQDQFFTATQLTFGAVALNEAGDVAGVNASGSAVLYSNSTGTVQVLGSLGTQTLVTDLNDHGQVVGYFNQGDATTRHAFLYSNGAMQDLGTRDSNATSSWAFSINNSGQIGFENWGARQGGPKDYIYDNGVLTPIDIGGQDINNAGAVAGRVGNSAAIYNNGTVQTLGTLGGFQASSAAYAINDVGQIAGVTTTWDSPLGGNAFLWSNGAMQDLGNLGGPFGGGGVGVNNLGEVVGASGIANPRLTPIYHAFLYRDGAMHDLNQLLDYSSPLSMYITLTDAIGINDDGLILAHGTDSRTGVGYSYLLTPSAVPLPAAAWLMLSGLGGLAGVTRRRRNV